MKLKTAPKAILIFAVVGGIIFLADKFSNVWAPKPTIPAVQVPDTSTAKPAEPAAPVQTQEAAAPQAPQPPAGAPAQDDAGVNAVLGLGKKK